MFKREESAESPSTETKKTGRISFTIPECSPPSFGEAMGPGFNPLGTAEDLAEAARIAGLSRIYAALRPTETSIQNNTRNMFLYFLDPRMWLCIPCCVPLLLAIRKSRRNSFYVITEDSVYVSVADHSVPCGCCIKRASNFVNKIMLEDVTHFFVDDVCRECCCSAPYLTLQSGDKSIDLLVENIDEVAHLIRTLIDRRRSKLGLHAVAANAYSNPTLGQRFFPLTCPVYF